MAFRLGQPNGVDGVDGLFLRAIDMVVCLSFSLPPIVINIYIVYKIHHMYIYI